MGRKGTFHVWLCPFLWQHSLRGVKNSHCRFLEPFCGSVWHPERTRCAKNGAIFFYPDEVAVVVNDLYDFELMLSHSLMSQYMTYLLHYITGEMRWPGVRLHYIIHPIKCLSDLWIVSEGVNVTWSFLVSFLLTSVGLTCDSMLHHSTTLLEWTVSCAVKVSTDLTTFPQSLQLDAYVSSTCFFDWSHPRTPLTTSLTSCTLSHWQAV